MSYTPTEWNTGDIISSEKLNKLEAGVEQAIELPDISGASDGDVLTLDNGEPTWAAPSGGGGVLIATLRADVDMQSGSLTFGNCSKTGAELKTAVSNGVIPFINFTMYADNAPFANMILVIDSIDVAGDIVSFAFYDASSGSQNVIMVYADGHAVMQSD